MAILTIWEIKILVPSGNDTAAKPKNPKPKSNNYCTCALMTASSIHMRSILTRRNVQFSTHPTCFNLFQHGFWHSPLENTPISLLKNTWIGQRVSRSWGLFLVRKFVTVGVNNPSFVRKLSIIWICLVFWAKFRFSGTFFWISKNPLWIIASTPLWISALALPLISSAKMHVRQYKMRWDLLNLW